MMTTSLILAGWSVLLYIYTYIQADATLFNLSLLTSDVYAVIYRYVALHQAVSK